MRPGAPSIRGFPADGWDASLLRTRSAHILDSFTIERAFDHIDCLMANILQRSEFAGPRPGFQLAGGMSGNNPSGGISSPHEHDLFHSRFEGPVPARLKAERRKGHKERLHRNFPWCRSGPETDAHRIGPPPAEVLTGCPRDAVVVFGCVACDVGVVFTQGGKIAFNPATRHNLLSCPTRSMPAPSCGSYPGPPARRDWLPLSPAMPRTIGPAHRLLL